MWAIGINLYLTQGTQAAVSAEEQKYVERIKTEVKNGVLKIYVDKAFLEQLELGEIKN